jgi:hypothetical protein
MSPAKISISAQPPADPSEAFALHRFGNGRSSIGGYTWGKAVASRRATSRWGLGHCGFRGQTDGIADDHHHRSVDHAERGAPDTVPHGELQRDAKTTMSLCSRTRGRLSAVKSH